MNTTMILKDYIREELMTGSNENLDDDANLLSAGIVDSLGLLLLVSFVEKHFGVEVADEDVTFDNFKSIRDITNYLERKK